MPGIFNKIRHSWHARRARKELETLTDRQLYDIGLRRDQIAGFTRAVPGPGSKFNLV